jgi:hypothetical protein
MARQWGAIRQSSESSSIGQRGSGWKGGRFLVTGKLVNVGKSLEINGHGLQL